MRRDEHAGRMLSRVGVLAAMGAAFAAASAAPPHAIAQQTPPPPPTPAPSARGRSSRWRPVDDRGIEIINEAKAERARKAAKLAHWNQRQQEGKAMK